MQFVDTLSGLAHIVLLPGAGVSPVLQVQKSSPFQHSGLTCLAWYDSWKNTENRWLLDLALVSHNDESKYSKKIKRHSMFLRKNKNGAQKVGHVKCQISEYISEFRGFFHLIMTFTIFLNTIETLTNLNTLH